MPEKKAIYPGSFDPITNGHVDIIQRGLKVFDKVIVAVLDNPQKAPLFKTRERVDMIQDIFPGQKKIVVQSFHGLLVDFVRARRANVVIRGLRAISDFEYEFQMALMNRKIYPAAETFFMAARETYSYVSSRILKEAASLGGCIDGLAPPVASSRMQPAKGDL